MFITQIPEKLVRCCHILCLGLATTSCLANVQGIKELETSLDNKIGKFYEYPTFESNSYWQYLSETSGKIEMEQRMENGCSYALIIDKETRVVQGWRFTSERSLCDFIRYKPAV